MTNAQRVMQAGGVGDVVDPTKNVLDLVEAAVKRIDDLRAVNDRLIEERIKRQDDLRTLASSHVKELAELRSKYEIMLGEKETQRIDAIRAVDVGAVGRASEVAAAQASTLATQVQVSAETLRGQVAASATAAAGALAVALEPIQKSIDELRRIQYEQQGQKAAQSEGRDSNQWTIGIIMGAALTITTIILHFFK
jgi:anti-sigma-K factor RskA